MNDKIIIVMNMNKRAIKFIINNEDEDKGESYTDASIDKPPFPSVCLSYQPVSEVLQLHYYQLTYQHHQHSSF